MANFGYTVRFDRNILEPERLLNVDMEATEKLSVRPGSYHVAPMGVLLESQEIVVSRAGWDKVLETSLNPDVEQEMIGYLVKPIQVRSAGRSGGSPVRGIHGT